MIGQFSRAAACFLRWPSPEGYGSRVSVLICPQHAPHYPYPHTLISTVIEATHQQTYFAQHLPALTDIKPDADATWKLTDYLEQMVLAAVAAYKQPVKN